VGHGQMGMDEAFLTAGHRGQGVGGGGGGGGVYEHWEGGEEDYGDEGENQFDRLTWRMCARALLGCRLWWRSADPPRPPAPRGMHIHSDDNKGGPVPWNPPRQDHSAEALHSALA